FARATGRAKMPKDHRGQHRSAVLAKNDVGNVSVCCCGTVSLNFGPMTLRVPAARLADIADLVNRSMQVLNSEDDLETVDESQHCH
ncbi:MAG: hypothetical protein AAF658_09595, partial [Myxococcota bacterium]